MAFSVDELNSYVNDNAPQYGLDAAAVLAVASQEGIGGGIGDGGSAFGPWQDHFRMGNRLSDAGRPDLIGASDQALNDFAWSTDGINYVLGQMGSVAGGMVGLDAIAAIVQNFERPRADLVAGEIAGAWQAYGSAGGGGGSITLPLIGSVSSGPAVIALLIAAGFIVVVGSRR